MAVSSFFRGLIKLLAATALVFGGFLLLMNPFATTEYANCVVVADQKEFTGEWLKHGQAEIFSRMLTEECQAQDRKLDNGDGPKSGKVRWAECARGPDCDEAGMF